MSRYASSLGRRVNDLLRAAGIPSCSDPDHPRCIKVIYPEDSDRTPDVCPTCGTVGRVLWVEYEDLRDERTANSEQAN